MKGINKMARYRYIVMDNKVICISTYAKKVVKGIAKCSPNDEFDIEIGKKLAKLRCDEKVANKRVNRAAKKYIEAEEILFEASQYLSEMRDYLCNSEVTHEKIIKELKKYENDLLN